MPEMQMIRTSSMRLVAADPLADFLAVDVRKHDVQHDQVGMIFLDHHAGVEAVVDAADLETPVALQHVGDQLDQLLVVVDQQHLPLAAFQGVGGDAVVPHEHVELLAGNAAETAAGHAESLQLSRVKTANDRLLADLADLGRLAGREHCLHVILPSLCLAGLRPASAKPRRANAGMLLRGF